MNHRKGEEKGGAQIITGAGLSRTYMVCVRRDGPSNILKHDEQLREKKKKKEGGANKECRRKKGQLLCSVSKSKNRVRYLLLYDGIHYE